MAVVKERVELGPRSYEINIGPGALAKAGALMGRLEGRALVVTCRRVERLHGDKLFVSLDKARIRWEKVILQEGERYKNMASVDRVHDALVRGKFDRNCVVVGFGGGVIGDIAGFAAATYMRGVKVAQIPTTLLAQVDSSVGGKTGVNHPKGKNLIGSFHQPGLVVADVSALETLPLSEILCGVAEVIKYGAIASEGFFKTLERDIDKLCGLDPVFTSKAVRTSCRIKADVVALDELETGRRAILNFGHTVGHAIEAVTGYKVWRHGHAVAMGMAVAATLSQIKGTLTGRDAERIKTLIRRAGLPATVPGKLDTGKLIKAMGHDKKVMDGKVRFVLLDGIGKCRVRDDVTTEEIKEAIKQNR